jgi:uncharacterized membrane protein
MTLPVEHAEEYLKLKEGFLGTTMKMMDSLRLLLAVLMSLLCFSVVITTIGPPSMMFIVTVIILSITAAMFAVCIYRTFQMIKITMQLKATTGRSYVQRQADAEHWLWGGLVYFNPDDPALWVEKMVGIGYTVNLGNKRAYLYLGYIALLPILIHVVMRG